MPCNRSGFAGADRVIRSPVAEAAYGRYDRACADSERFRDFPRCDVAQRLLEVDAVFFNRIPEGRRQAQQRIARDARQDCTGQCRRADVPAFVNEGDVHGADFVDVAALDRVQPQDLLITGCDRLLGSTQAAGVVARRFGFAGSASHRAHEIVGHEYRHGLETTGEIRRDGTEDDVMQETAAGTDFQGVLGCDHHRADVKRCAGILRRPRMLEPDQFGDRLHMFLDVHAGHGHALGGAVEALRILFRAEQVKVAVRTHVGLGSLEYHLATMEHFSGGIDRQRPVGADGCIVPALLGGVVAGEHAGREVTSEPERIGQGLRCRAMYRFDANLELLHLFSFSARKCATSAFHSFSSSVLTTFFPARRYQ